MTRKALALWIAAQVVVFVFTMLTFFSLAPWEGTEPISKAPPEARQALPARCPAFSVNHGTYICEWRGTKQSNPAGYWTNEVLFDIGVAFLIFTGLTGRGLQLPPPWGAHPKRAEPVDQGGG